MKNINFSMLITFIFIFIGFSCSVKELQFEDRVRSFDSDWRFLKGNPDGAEQTAFDDADWRILDLPHDWSIEDLPGQDGESVIGPFSKASVGKMGTGFTVGGTAWYRKHFTINPADKDKTVYLQFDGIYMNADVWINGQHLGNHPHGYTSFWYDITPHLNKDGASNVVAVQVKNEGFNARWYSGSGIYRHTWLKFVNPVHINTWGVSVETPSVTTEAANVIVSSDVVNTGSENASIDIQVEIVNPEGTSVVSTMQSVVIEAGNKDKIQQNVNVQRPLLWSPEETNLYTAKVTVLQDNTPIDISETKFGIRTIAFSAEKGFQLNGKNILLRGGCFHHDNGPLGAAAIYRAEERKIEILKDAGFNAIRCSHNPPSPYLLDVCDRLGMLVIDEAFDMWELPKMESLSAFFGGSSENFKTTEYAYHFKEWWQKDLHSMILRDRNHPSIIMWSIGNEIPEAADTSGLRIARSLVKEVKKLDNTRPITEAHVDMGAEIGMGSTWEQRAPHLELMDVIGYNYGFEKYKDDHSKYPNRIMYSSEFRPPRSLQNWQAVEELPYVIGNFSWTAMDYLGEAGTGVPRLVEDVPTDPSNPFAEMIQFFDFNSWPMFVNFQGDIDLIGNPKAAYYYQHVVWRDNKIAMLVHRPIPAGKREVVSPWGFPDELKSWTWEGHEGEKLQVNVYTRCELVKLELNGKPIGEQSVDQSKSITAAFEVPYEPGTLTARCFDNGVEVASETIKTVGNPAAIKLTADREAIKADRNDLSYVMVEITDEEGNIIPNADDIEVKFEIAGNAEIAGVGNGSPTDLSSFQQPFKRTWHGRCLAIIRPNGPAGQVTLTAQAEGLIPSSVNIITR